MDVPVHGLFVVMVFEVDPDEGQPPGVGLVFEERDLVLKIRQGLAPAADPHAPGAGVEEFFLKVPAEALGGFTDLSPFCPGAFASGVRSL